MKQILKRYAMRRYIKILTVLIFIFPTTSIGDTCSELESSYYHLDKLSLYDSISKSVRDTGNSAPRATTRKLDELVNVMRQMILLEFMGNQKCTFPQKVRGGYATEALDCGIASMTNPETPKCDVRTWQGEK